MIDWRFHPEGLLLKFALVSPPPQQPLTAWWDRGVPGPLARLPVELEAPRGAASCRFPPETAAHCVQTSSSGEDALGTTPSAAAPKVRVLNDGFLLLAAALCTYSLLMLFYPIDHKKKTKTKKNTGHLNFTPTLFFGMFMFMHLLPERKQSCAITSSDVTCRSGKDPARLFQEELQGPVEATTHDDEGGEGQVGPSLPRGKQTHGAASPLCACLCRGSFQVQPPPSGR